MLPGLPELGSSALQQVGVHECLREVPPQLALGDVELLREEAGGAAGGAVALEPAGGIEHIALLQVGEGEDEAAKQEGAFGLA
jgi:hypothetical protein